MVVRVVRLGTPRVNGEGLRIGTVRRPPRGVPKSEFASQDWYDVWFPNLAPSAETTAARSTPAARAARATLSTASKSTERNATFDPATLIVVPSAM